MGNLSKENLEKLARVKEELYKQGYVVETEEKKDERTYTEEEEKALNETMRVWGISREQAIMIYSTVKTIPMLRYTNELRRIQLEKKIGYDKLQDMLEASGAFIKSVESTEEKYYGNQIALLSGELTPAEEIVLRKRNEVLEGILEERRPRVQKETARYYALGAVIYYGEMVDYEHSGVRVVKKPQKEIEQGKLMPSYREMDEI